MGRYGKTEPWMPRHSPLGMQRPRAAVSSPHCGDAQWGATVSPHSTAPGGRGYCGFPPGSRLQTSRSGRWTSIAASWAASFTAKPVWLPLSTSFLEKSKDRGCRPVGRAAPLILPKAKLRGRQWDVGVWDSFPACCGASFPLIWCLVCVGNGRQLVPEACVGEGVFRSTAFHLQTVLLTFDPCSYLHRYFSPSSSAAGNSLPLIGFCSSGLGEGGWVPLPCTHRSIWGFCVSGLYPNKPCSLLCCFSLVINVPINPLNLRQKPRTQFCCCSSSAFKWSSGLNPDSVFTKTLLTDPYFPFHLSPS